MDKIMKIEFNKLCRKCAEDCKQFMSSKIIHCPQFKKQDIIQKEKK